MLRSVQMTMAFALSAAVTGCATAPPAAPEEAPVVGLHGDELVYRGPIGAEGNRLLFDAAATALAPLRTLVITSKGGEIEAGMALGTWVYEHALDVRIPEYCTSSCANYVFTAGRQKILAPHALVLWHGGATQESLGKGRLCDGVDDPRIECDEQQLQALMAESLVRWRRHEAAFFERIGVRQEITVLGQWPEYDCREDIDARVRLGWYYSLADLERLGVHDVTVPGGEWRPESPVPGVGFCRVTLGKPFRLDASHRDVVDDGN